MKISCTAARVNAECVIHLCSGITGASISSVTGSGSFWIVTVSTGSGNGALGLNMTSSTGVTDAATLQIALGYLLLAGVIYGLSRGAAAAPAADEEPAGEAAIVAEA